MAAPEYLMFYDADCGLCRFFRNWVHRLDLHGRIRSIPLAARESDPFLSRLGDTRRHGSMHAIGPDGTLVSEGWALLCVLEALPTLGGFARLVRSRERGVLAAEVVYEFLVLLRDALAR